MKLVLALLCFSALADDIPPHILKLAKIQRQVADELSRLPNYTCLETIDRYKAAPAHKMIPYDRIRINVAIVNSKELYAWPGASAFDDRSFGQIVHSGFMSDGDFSVMTRNLFINRTASITWVGEENVDGRRLLHYDFYMSQLASGWRLRMGNASGELAARGSFWADAGTLDLVRLRFAAEDMPAFTSERAIDESMDYARTKLGDADVLLPLTVDVHSESFDKSERWNHATFSFCREYTATSTISFGDETAALNRNKTPPSEINIAVPGGLDLPLRLETQIDTSRASIGDEIRATVTRDIRDGDEIVARRDSVATGVIRLFEHRTGNRPYIEVGIEFNQIGNSVLFAELDHVSPFRGFHKNVVGYAGGPPKKRDRGVGYFYVEGPEIPKGTTFIWHTQTVRTR